MTTRGLLNIETNGRTLEFNQKTLSYPTQESFTTVYNFLNSSVCQELGIYRRSYNMGSTTSVYNVGYQFTTSPGTGMNYYDQQSPSGNNAWAVFEFTNANPSFWILIQFSSEEGALSVNTLGNSPGYPARCQGFSTALSYPYDKGPSFGISVAFYKDGSTPWNGTTLNDGTDTKIDPVWISGSVAFPRSNQSSLGNHYSIPTDVGSAYFTTSSSDLMQLREGIVGTNAYPDLGSYRNSGDSYFDSYSGIMHVIVSEETLLILTDPKGIGQYSIFYFGKYSAMLESNNWANYVCLQQYNSRDGYTILHRYGDATNTTYGSRFAAQSTNNTNTVTIPKIQGGANHPLYNQTRGVILDNNNLLSGSSDSDVVYLRFPNRLFGDMTGRNPGVFDVFNIPIACFEDNHYYGHLGEIDFIKLTRDLPTNSTINNKEYAVFGGTIKNSIKVVVPWDGKTNPGMQGATRTGILW